MPIQNIFNVCNLMSLYICIQHETIKVIRAIIISIISKSFPVLQLSFDLFFCLS
jgi:hypothetical protein